MDYVKKKFTCNRGGLTIRGVEYLPDGNNLPVAVVSHGFMANYKTVLQYVKLLASMGYASYTFDFCGGCVVGGKSDGKTSDMSVLTEVKDLKAVIEYVSSLPYINADELLLMGCSQGGFVSALTAAELKEKVSKLVLFYPALCIPDDARAGQMMFAKFNPENPPETFYCGPMKLGRQYITDVINMNPYEEIKSYMGDVLIVHGTDDKIVNVHYAKEAEKIYKERESGIIKTHIIDGGNHMFSKRDDIIAMKYLTEFLVK